MKTIHFNTGRPYTVHGQRITATLHDDNVVTFHDHDRMVDGEYETKLPSMFRKEQVMRFYDNYEAKGTGRSWRDAFAQDGCNGTFQGETS